MGQSAFVGTQATSTVILATCQASASSYVPAACGMRMTSKLQQCQGLPILIAVAGKFLKRYTPQDMSERQDILEKTDAWSLGLFSDEPNPFPSSDRQSLAAARPGCRAGVRCHPQSMHDHRGAPLDSVLI